jgi:hypothetical protein
MGTPTKTLNPTTGQVKSYDVTGTVNFDCGNAPNTLCSICVCATFYKSPNLQMGTLFSTLCKSTSIFACNGSYSASMSASIAYPDPSYYYSIVIQTQPVDYTQDTPKACLYAAGGPSSQVVGNVSFPPYF